MEPCGEHGKISMNIGNPLGTAVAPPGDTREGGKPPPTFQEKLFWELPCHSWGIFACRKGGGRRKIGFSRVGIPCIPSWKRFPVLWHLQNSNPGVNGGFGSALCLEHSELRPGSGGNHGSFPVLGDTRPDPGAPGRILGKGEKMGLGDGWWHELSFFFVHNGCK